MNRAAHPTPAQAAGGDAEDAAAQFLTRQGLAIVARNYRTRLGEIDLIARERDVLVFVEVKMRKNWIPADTGTTGRKGGVPPRRFGGAVESITARKRARIAAAARQYLMRLPREPVCRFDVVCLDGHETTWLRGAFELA